MKKNGAKYGILLFYRGFPCSAELCFISSLRVFFALSHSLFLVCRPQNGSMILYNRKKVKYRKDGYCWKKRKDGKTTREDHMKLKVQGVEVGELCKYSPSFFTWKLCMYVIDSHQTGNFHSNCHRFTYAY